MILLNGQIHLYASIFASSNELILVGDQLMVYIQLFVHSLASKNEQSFTGTKLLIEKSTNIQFYAVFSVVTNLVSDKITIKIARNR